ncbi:PREDICTED: structural maintenance of chromosomes protein 1B-like, partial [Cyprinodon variegatus]|uniref:structural maintenance of chromosomes protein 1B-like n=1 Tax=Cyprinodon variegatus TaxID=28743 RepID=UPI000742A19F
ALKYQALVDDLNHKRLKLSLVELFYNEKSISAISETLREKQEDAAGKTDELVTAEQRVKAHKKEHGRLSREQQHLEKEIRGQEHILAQSSSQYVKAKVNTSHHIKKAAEISAAVMRNKKKLESKEQELEEGQQEMAELEKTWRRYERQTQEEGVAKGRDISLDEDQLDQYKELKRLAQKQAAVLFQQAEKLQWEVTADTEKLAFEQRRKKEKEFGRLSDLCSPVHKKYQLAVTKVFGSNMNAIVVATEKVARECICFLKEQRGEPETFLPVDYLVVKTLNQRLRDIPNDEKKLLQVVEEGQNKLQEMKNQLLLRKKQVASLKAELSQKTQHLQEINNKWNKVSYEPKSFNASTKVVQKCNKEFEEVKTQRLKLFNQCFEHVVLVIDRIYKKICRNKGAQLDHCMFSRILTLDLRPYPLAEEENDKARAEEARTDTRMSWCGATGETAPIISCIWEPEQKVTSFIREESKVNMQIIVISLKEEFFSKADALLGVCSNLDHCMVSRILTLDLRPYPLAEEENDKARAEEARTDTRLESSTLKKTP